MNRTVTSACCSPSRIGPLQPRIVGVVLHGILLGTLGFGMSLGRAEEEPPQTPEPPKVLMLTPLGGQLGQTTQVKARGLRLEATTDVKTSTEGVSVKFQSQGKVGLPQNLNADQAGDTQVEFELTLADEVSAETAQLVFVTPDGEATYRLPLQNIHHTILEVEPNPGFSQPQEIAFPQVVLGQIERSQDVDVFAVELPGGQTVQIKVEAAVHGSAIDSLVTLADGHGTSLVVNDDNGESRDSQIEFTVPVTGRYLVVVQDASDLGGEAHPYRLSVVAAGHPDSSNGLPKISFVGQIAPILQRQCVACHGPRKAEGGYRLDTYQHLVSEGDSGNVGFAAHSPDNSESFRRITADDAGERMPLDAEPLPADQVALIRTWIEQGSKFDGEDPDAPLISQIPAVTHPEPPQHYAAPLPLTAMAFSPDGQQLLIGGYHEITVWHPTEGRLLRRIGQVGQRTYQITWHPSGDQFAVACGTPGQFGEVRIFTRDGGLHQVLAVSPDVIHDVAYNPAGDQIAVATSDGSIQVYDLEQGTLRLEISSHLDWVLSVAWSPDGSKLASGSRDKTAKVFDADSGRLLASYLRHNAAVRGVLFHPSGDEVYSSGENHRWDRWKVSEAAWVKDMHLGGEGFKLLGIGSFFLVPSANNRVHLMKADESERVRELRGPGDLRLLSVAAHEATDRIAAGGHRGEVIVWEFSTGKKIVDFQGIPSSQ